MTWQEAIARWRKLPTQEKQRRRWESIPTRVARSMAFEGEQVSLAPISPRDGKTSALPMTNA